MADKFAMVAGVNVAATYPVAASPQVTIPADHVVRFVKIVNLATAGTDFVEVSFDGTSTRDRLIPGTADSACIYEPAPQEGRISKVYLRGTNNPAVKVSWE